MRSLVKVSMAGGPLEQTGLEHSGDWHSSGAEGRGVAASEASVPCLCVSDAQPELCPDKSNMGLN